MTEPGPGFAGLTLEAFTERLASDNPTPGGGSAAAVAGSLAASLLSMVAALSLGRSTFEPYVTTINRARAVGEDARITFLELASADARAYDAFSDARRLPRDTPEQTEARKIALRAAARGATEVPLRVIRTCGIVAVELEALAGRCNLNCASDLTVGALLVDAAAHGAAANVYVNLRFIGDPDFEVAAQDETTEALKIIEDLAAQVREQVGGGRMREPERV